MINKIKEQLGVYQTVHSDSSLTGHACNLPESHGLKIPDVLSLYRIFSYAIVATTKVILLLSWIGCRIKMGVFMKIDTGIDIKELRCFASVVENRSFSRAAKQLNLTQPTVSVHISTLEQKLGICLIVRASKESYASDAGRVYYHYIKDIFRLRQKAIDSISRYSTGTESTIQTV